jgi:hypothetical protein
MSEHDLLDILRKLKSTTDYSTSSSLLSRAKLTLLKLNALTPVSATSQSLLGAARAVFEAGALISIRAKDPESFTRYVNQLQPFYELPENVLSPEGSERAKITGLYLLLLLVKGDYAGFHTELEGLEIRGGDVENDKYLGYPVRLERWLMEGSYDRVWKAMASREVPSEEYGIFSEVRLPVHCHLLLLLYTVPHFHLYTIPQLRTRRSSSPASAPKSPPVASALTHPSPSPRPKTCSSWTAKVPSCNSHRAAAGRSRTAASISRCSKKALGWPRVRVRRS